VDVPVSRSIGETYRNVDTQLDTAVQELMNQIQNKKSTPQRITAQ